MSKKSTLSAMAVAGAMTAAAALAVSPAMAAKDGMEKCYGVTKAGMNDCGGAKNSCAGTSTLDYQGDAWKYVPTGTCTTFATPYGGGSLEAREYPLPKSS